MLCNRYPVFDSRFLLWVKSSNCNKITKEHSKGSIMQIIRATVCLRLQIKFWLFTTETGIAKYDFSKLTVVPTFIHVVCIHKDYWKTLSPLKHFFSRKMRKCNAFCVCRRKKGKILHFSNSHLIKYQIFDLLVKIEKGGKL